MIFRNDFAPIYHNFAHKRKNAARYSISNRIFRYFARLIYFAANSTCIFSVIVASSAFMIEFLT